MACLSIRLKGFNFLLLSPNKILDRKGVIVLMSSSYEGRGYHSLLGETGARLYENFGEGMIWRAYVRRKPVYFYSPNISKSDLNHFLPKTVKLFNEWNELIEDLNNIFGESIKAAVFPSSIQLPE